MYFEYKLAQLFFSLYIFLHLHLGHFLRSFMQFVNFIILIGFDHDRCLEWLINL